MYKVQLWVPTRGWKTVAEYANEREALTRALEFVPLETQVVGNGYQRVSGRCHQPMEADPGLSMIEKRLAELSK